MLEEGTRGSCRNYTAALIQCVYAALQQRQPLEGQDERVQDFTAKLLRDTCLSDLFCRCVESHLRLSRRNAIFFAERLATLTEYHPLAVHLLAVCELAGGDGTRAATLLTRHGLPTLHDSFAVLAGAALVQARQFEQAVRVLSGTPQEGEPDPVLAAERRLLLGQAHLALDACTEAEVALAEATTQDCGNFAAWEAMAELAPAQVVSFPQWLDSLGGPELRERLQGSNDAHFHLGQAQESLSRYQLSAAQDACEAVLRSDPLRLDVLPLYAELLAERRQTAELFAVCAAAAEAYPNHAITLHVFGVYYALLDRPETARRCLARAVQLDRRALASWLLLGHVLAQQEEAEQALGVYRSCARLFPHSALPPLCLGMEYARANTLRTALLSLRQAERLAGADPLVANELGCALLKERKPEEAKRALLRALAACAPDAMPVLRHALLHNLATAHRRLGEHAQAVQCLEEALRARPDEPAALFALAFALHLAGQLPRAALIYHRVVALRHETHFADLMLRNCLADSADGLFIT